MESEEKTVAVDVNEAFIVKSDAGDLCRLCANTDNQLIPIFRGEGLEHNIPNKIEKHLPIIKVTEIDKLPLQICYQCASTLIAWHNLYEGCRVADKRLREILCIDDKLYQDDEPFGDYVDDYRDDYDDQSRTNYEAIPLSSTPSTSDLPANNLLKNTSTEITQLDEAKTFNETELDSTDERFASSKPTSVEQATKKEMGDATSARLAEHEHSTPDDAIGSAPQHAETICDCRKCAACVERDSLKCNFCPMVFVDRADIKRHLSSSHSDGSLKRKTSAIAKSAAKVAKTDDDDANSTSSVHQCKVCLKVCLSFRGLTRHSAIHKNDPKTESASCSYCEQTFASEEEKRSHVSNYHRIMTSEENDSGASFMPNSVCEVSVKVDDEKENVADEEKKDDKKPTRKRAKKSEPGAEELACEECGKTFDKKATYVRHKHTHSMSSEFVCDICQKGFSSEIVMKRHKSNAHRSKRGKSAEDDPFSKWYVFADGQKHLKCDQCKYNSLWYHKGRFLEHYRIHTGEKPFTCDLCGKQFRTKTLLQKHVMFVHEGIKEHPCDICGRCFSDKRYMEDHRRIHTGERPYVCDLCGKTFKQSASLFIHKELHKGLRKHGCEMCGKRFTTRSSLTIHIKRHIGERNFICATCGKAFVDGKHLKDHMAVHSEERPFSCELCGGRFKLMKHLKQHGRTHKRDYTT